MTAVAVPAVDAGIEEHVGEGRPRAGAGRRGRRLRRRVGWHGLEFRRETGGSLPAGDGSVDAVVIAPPAALSRPRGALLGEIARVLRPGGRLVVRHPSPA